MSQYDTYTDRMDPTPRPRSRSGPFTNQLKSIAEAVAFCEKMGLDPSEVRLAHNYVMWEDTESPDEVQSRIAGAKLQQDQHLSWVRANYEAYRNRGLYE